MKVFRMVLSLFAASLAAAQQSPSIFVEKFNTAKSYRTDVCDRQRLLWNNSIQLPDALRGLDLTVVITNYQNGNSEDEFFSLKDGKIKETDPGLFAVIIDEVARRAGFRWRNSFGVASRLNPEVDGADKSWTDILEWGVDTFDISVEKWGHSVGRMSRGISFPTGWYDSSIVFVEHFESNQSKHVVNIWAFLKPFDSTVWLTISGAIVITGLLYWLLEYLDVDADEGGLDEKPLALIFYAATTFTGHFGFQPNTNAARILGFSWTFWALIVASAYTANLASFLVSPRVNFYRISTVEDALRTNAAVCVQGKSVMGTILKERHPELNLVGKQPESEIFNALRVNPKDGGCDAAAHQFNSFMMYERNKEVNYDCTLSSEKRIEEILPAGIATAIDTGLHYCTSLVSHVLDYHLTEMVAEGFVEQAWANHLNKIGTIECIAEPQRGGGGGDDVTFSLGLQDVGGIFILHLILSVAAMALALFQFYYYNTGETRTIQEVFGLKKKSRAARRREAIARRRSTVDTSGDGSGRRREVSQ
jgi:hypothetical protein